jgi:hypothetical protein
MQASGRIKPSTRNQKSRSRHTRHISEPNFNHILKQTGPITDQKTWARAQALEDDIASLIDQKDSRPLAFMTYRSWKERGSKLGAGTVDLLYAQRIAEKARIVRKESSKQPQFLANLKQKMMAVAAISAEDMSPEAELDLLCVQKHLPPACLPIEQIIEKVVKTKKGRTMPRAETRDANAAHLITYAASRMDKLQERVDELHLGALNSSSQ